MTELSSFGRGRSVLTRNRLRIVFVAILLISTSVVATAASNGLSTASREEIPKAPPSNGHTVITESGREGTITVYGPDSNVQYYNNSHTKYFDVDPLKGNPMTIEYAVTDTIHTKGPTCSDPPCTKNALERVNLETGKVEILYERYDYKETAGEWHDIDRLNETHVLVADIVADQIFIVNTKTEIVEWLWDAQSDFPVDGGGSYPEDWAHINDVEYIEEGTNAGRIMVSLRNQDQVVFIDPKKGLQEKWTLGAEDDYDVMFEQHNPDYIPEARGGPAIVVSDSENGRVQEFQRIDGEWKRTWEWSDGRMQWPRDADRLPNGNTLVTDTHGNRVMEISPNGEIVWQVKSALPYDAERLETGDESAGGHSAQQLNYSSRTANTNANDVSEGDSLSVLAPLTDVIKSIVPHRIVNGILFISPPWMGSSEFTALGISILIGITWVGLEFKWHLHDAGVRFRLPVYRRGD